MINPITCSFESVFNSSYSRNEPLMGWMSVGLHILPKPLDTDVVSGCISDVRFELNETLHNTIKLLLMAKVREFMNKKV